MKIQLIKLWLKDSRGFIDDKVVHFISRGGHDKKRAVGYDGGVVSIYVV